VPACPGQSAGGLLPRRQSIVSRAARSNSVSVKDRSRLAIYAPSAWTEDLPLVVLMLAARLPASKSSRDIQNYQAQRRRRFRTADSTKELVKFSRCHFG